MRIHASHRHPDRRLRQIVTSELEFLVSALRANALDARRVHRIRRATKRIEAIAALVRAGGHVPKHVRSTLRRVRHELTDLRDLDVMLQTLDQITAVDASFAAAERTPLRAALLAQRRQAAAALRRNDVLPSFATSIVGVLDGVGTWRLEGRGMDALSPGLRRSHRRCRRAFADARASRSNAAYHRLRRRLSALRLQLGCIRRRDVPEAARLPAIRRACQQLGDARNLAGLEAWLHAADPAAPGTRAFICTLGPVIRRRSRALHAAAIRSAAPICQLTTRDYLSRVSQSGVRTSAL